MQNIRSRRSLWPSCCFQKQKIDGIPKRDALSTTQGRASFLLYSMRNGALSSLTGGWERDLWSQRDISAEKMRALRHEDLCLSLGMHIKFPALVLHIEPQSQAAGETEGIGACWPASPAYSVRFRPVREPSLEKQAWCLLFVVLCPCVHSLQFPRLQTVSLCSLGCSGIHFVEYAGLELIDLPVSWVLTLKTYIITST